MAKTRRMIEAELKTVDAVCEIVDARLPIASRNPDIDVIVGAMARMVILNRADQADPDATARWRAWFELKGMKTVAAGCGSGLSDLEAYRRAVRFYFPGADIRMSMTVDLIGEAGKDQPQKKQDTSGIVLDFTQFL